jgi:hypothetical protein
MSFVEDEGPPQFAVPEDARSLTFSLSSVKRNCRELKDDLLVVIAEQACCARR